MKRKHPSTLIDAPPQTVYVMSLKRDSGRAKNDYRSLQTM